jgi:hypothetical protein
MQAPHRSEGPALRHAALIAGVALLLMAATAPVAEFAIFPKLIVRGNIEQTVQNIVGQQGLFVAGIFCYLVNFICDVMTAWALYILLAPVNRSVSLLTAWFQLVYAGLAIFNLFKLSTVLRLLTTPDYLALFAPSELHAQVKLLLDTFRQDWSLSLMLFDIHLILLGCLVYLSGYIPRPIGILLVIDGLGWLIDGLSPYFYPHAWLGFVSLTSLGELVFMLWLLIMGRRICEPTPLST